MSSPIVISMSHWISVCAIADLMGFSPREEDWVELVRQIKKYRPYWTPEDDWWNNGLYLKKAFSEEDTRAFFAALQTYRNDWTPEQLRDLTKDSEQAILFENSIKAFPLVESLLEDYRNGYRLCWKLVERPGEWDATIYFEG